MAAAQAAAAAAAAAAALYSAGGCPAVPPPNHFLYSQWLATRNTSALFGLQGKPKIEYVATNGPSKGAAGSLYDDVQLAPRSSRLKCLFCISRSNHLAIR